MDATKNTSNITAQAGRSFDVILESMVGSTGYGWCLNLMPPGIELISTAILPIHPGIGPVRQIFTFAAIKPLKNGLLEFDLLCLHDLSRESADHACFIVDVHNKDEDDVLKQEIGAQKFLRMNGTMVHARPIPPYGFADAEKAVLLYGFPPSGESSPSVIASEANCMLKYGNPFGIAIEESECVLKYGYPVVKYGMPPVYKYGFPITSVSGKPMTVREDPKQCNVKYGTAFGVAGNAEECVLKYGFPVKN